MTQKSNETEIALLKQDRSQIVADIAELKASVKRIEDFLMGENPKVVTKKEFDDYVSRAEKRNWVQNTLSAILGATLAILIGYFITHIGK